MDKLKEIVFLALKNAKENGYEEFVLCASSDEVAEDLAENDSDLEEADVETIEGFVKEWRSTQKDK